MRNESATMSGDVQQAVKSDEAVDHRGSDDSNRKHRGIVRLSIAWLESVRIPKALQRRGENVDPDGTPVISGLDRVVFGTQPACEAVLICGIHPPRYLCYMLSGFICDLIQFSFDLVLHKVFLLENASVCWALGFGISVAFRHTSHRYLVFGDYVGGYWQSLGRMYAGYSIILVISTVFNIVMTQYLQLTHYVAWVVTLLWTGIVNYFILKKLWSFGGKQKKDEEPPTHGHTKDLELGSSPQKESESRLQSRKVEIK